VLYGEANAVSRGQRLDRRGFHLPILREGRFHRLSRTLVELSGAGSCPPVGILTHEGHDVTNSRING
jgi:hypothetical protein